MHRRFGKVEAIVLSGVTLLAVSLILFVACRTPDKPENVDDFTLSGCGKLQFLCVYESGSFKPWPGVPLVSAALGESFLEQNYNGVYNKFHMRCRFQVASGLANQVHLGDYRVLLKTSKASLLLDLHSADGTIRSDDFVCVRDPGILSLPSVKEIRMADGDTVRATLVKRRINAR